MDRPKRGLVVGGSRGIGAALTTLLRERGWIVRATGRADFDIGRPETWDAYMLNFPEDYCFDLVVFSAGEVKPARWETKHMDDYLRAYAVHAAGPVCFLARYKWMFPWWTRVIAISTVGAVNEHAADLTYGAAKAALEKIAKALGGNTSWPVTCVRLDLVDTSMLDALPPETLRERPVLTPREAAELIAKEAGL